MRVWNGRWPELEEKGTPPMTDLIPREEAAKAIEGYEPGDAIDFDVRLELAAAIRAIPSVQPSGTAMERAEAVIKKLETECGWRFGGDGFPQLLDAITLALTEAEQRGREAERKDGQFAWLIEREDSEASSPMYWCGGPPVPQSVEPIDRPAAWTSNHEHAIRFSRKVDALRLVQRTYFQVPVRICEHGWSP